MSATVISAPPRDPSPRTTPNSLMSTTDNVQTLIIETLPPVPGRVIIVGDVHGCRDQLELLVREVGYGEGDALVSVGDLVNKGPHSIDVVKMAMSLGMVTVLGNHEWTLLKLISQIERGVRSRNAKSKDPVHRLASVMPLDCIAYLRRMPHILRIPQYNIVVAHGGLDPSLPLEAQVVFDVLHTRHLVPDEAGAWRCSDKAVGVPWAKRWAGPARVVFGHDALAGLQQEAFAVGIDTGCVYGHPLTAYVLPGGTLAQVPGLPNAVSPPSVTPPTGGVVTSPPEDLTAISRLMSAIASTRPASAVTPTDAVTRVTEVYPSMPAPSAVKPPPTNLPSPTGASVARSITAEWCTMTFMALVSARHVDAIVTLLATPSYNAAWNEALHDESVLTAEDFDVLQAALVAAVVDGGDGVVDRLVALREMVAARPQRAAVADVLAMPKVSTDASRLVKSIKAIARLGRSV